MVEEDGEGWGGGGDWHAERREGVKEEEKCIFRK